MTGDRGIERAASSLDSAHCLPSAAEIYAWPVATTHFALVPWHVLESQQCPIVDQNGNPISDHSAYLQELRQLRHMLLGEDEVNANRLRRLLSIALLAILTQKGNPNTKIAATRMLADLWGMGRTPATQMPYELLEKDILARAEKYMK